MKKSATRGPHPQLSFDAVLVHALMLLAVAITATAAGILGPDSHEWPAALAVGGASVVVLGAWSAVLALRARRKGETSRWPKIVLCLLGAEVILGGAFWLAMRFTQYTLYDWTILLGLPVFLPVFGLATLIAAPIAWWRARRAERLDVKRGGVPWDSRRRWKRGLAWFCPIAFVVALVALPMPLFVFCANTCSEAWFGGSDWHWWVVRHTPAAVGEGSAALLAESRQPRFVRLYGQVLATGRVGEERLIAELSSADTSVRHAAYGALLRENWDTASALAHRVGRGRFTVQDSEIERHMGAIIGNPVNEEDTARYTDPAQKPWPPPDFLEGFLASAGGEVRARYLRRLELLCDGDSQDREAALKQLARFANREDIERLWPKYLADKNTDRRKQAIAAISFIPNPNVLLNVLAGGLESSDSSLRREVMRNIDELFTAGYEVADTNTVARLVRALLPLLDDAELATRQDAAWGLVALIKAPELEKRVRAVTWTSDDPPKKYSPLSDEAKKLVGEVRAAARQWLERHP